MNKRNETRDNRSAKYREGIIKQEGRKEKKKKVDRKR